MMIQHEDAIVRHLSQFVSEHKKEFVEKVLNNRTRYVTLVLEDIFQSQNASAVIRTAECMGLQDVHIVENTAKYQLNIRVLKGSYKWMELHRYHDNSLNNTEVCYSKLKAEGYTILVTSPDEDGESIQDIDLTQGKIAVVFGNELRGCSAYATEHAHKKIKIPMYGFTESLNISVCVGMCLNTFIPKLHQGNIPFHLSEQDKQHIRLNWFRKMVRKSDLIEREFVRSIV